MQRFRRMFMKAACLMVQYAPESELPLEEVIGRIKEEVQR